MKKPLFFPILVNFRDQTVKCEIIIENFGVGDEFLRKELPKEYPFYVERYENIIYALLTI